MKKRILAGFCDYLLVYLLVSVLVGAIIIPTKENKIIEEFSRKTMTEIKEISKIKDNKEASEKYKNINKNLEKMRLLNLKSNSNLYMRIIYLVIMLIYYVIIPTFNGGMTLFKYIFKIKIKRVDNKKINLKTMLSREMFAFCFMNLFALFLIILAKSNFNPKMVLRLDNNIYILRNIYLIINLILIINRGRGIHDLITKTEVVSIEDKKESNIIERMRKRK